MPSKAQTICLIKQFKTIPSIAFTKKLILLANTIIIFENGMIAQIKNGLNFIFKQVFKHIDDILHKMQVVVVSWIM